MDTNTQAGRTETRRYNVALIDNRGGRASEALAHESGTVVSTVDSFDGLRDLAIIEIPVEDAEWFEERLDTDDNVVSYHRFLPRPRA